MRFSVLKRENLISVFALLALAMGGFWLIFMSGVFFRTHNQNSANRQAMLRIRAAIPVGTHCASVRAAFDRFRTPELTMVEDSSTRWTCNMPPEGGEQAWKLLIYFQEEQVTAVRVRTGDGVPPKDAPPDIGPANHPAAGNAEFGPHYAFRGYSPGVPDQHR